MQALEPFIAPLSFGMLLTYHLVLVWQIRTAPLTVTLGLARRIRTLWVRTIMEGRQDILAVQTLRNWTMGATFLSSASILLGLGAVNLAFMAERTGELPAGDHALWMSKLAALGVLFLSSFFSFTIAVRYFNHVGMMITLLDREHNPGFPPEAVQSILERGATQYSLGMRLLYHSIPLSLWLFGPWWLLAGSVALIVALVWLDRGL